MKANFFQILWILFYSSMVTLHTCCKGILRGLLGKADRTAIDRYLQQWAKSIVKVLKIALTIHNPHQIQLKNDQAYIIMCNHSSLYDIPLSFLAFTGQSLRMIAKKELFKIPIFGQAMRFAHFPAIDRKNRQQAQQDLAYAKQLLHNGYRIWIAPEGTRSRTGHLLPLKKGGFTMAIETQATILPIYIQGAHCLLPAKTWSFHLKQPVHIHICEPINTTNYTLDQRDQLMQGVQNQWLQLEAKKDSSC